MINMIATILKNKLDGLCILSIFLKSYLNIGREVNIIVKYKYYNIFEEKYLKFHLICGIISVLLWASVFCLRRTV